MTQNFDKQRLRRHLRTCRNGLSKSDQRRASRRLQRQISRLMPFKKARHVATYLATDGELDPDVLRNAPGKTWYLPRLDSFRHNRLLFLPSSGPLRRNRYGIPEPTALRRQRRPRHLDIILVPLVGFDRHCTRLGMGGGFYDRTMSYRNHFTCWQRPCLIGIAHTCQQVDYLPRATWDVRLDYIVTDLQVFTRTRADRDDSR